MTVCRFVNPFLFRVLLGDYNSGTFSGTARKSRLRSRSESRTADCRTIQAFMLEMRAVFCSNQCQFSACPSAKVKVPPLLCRVAGKLIQVHKPVPKSHQWSGALMPNALC